MGGESTYIAHNKSRPDPPAICRAGIANHSPNPAGDMHWQAGLQVAWALVLSLTGASAPSSPSPSPVVPGFSDTGVIILGTALCLLVIYAIVAAHLRKED